MAGFRRGAGGRSPRTWRVACFTVARPAVASRLPLPTRRGMSREEAAEYIGVSPGTLDKLVNEGRMPPPWRAGSRAVYDRDALNLALDRENGIVAATDDATPNPWAN